MLTQMQEAKANGADVVESRVDHIPGFNAAKDLPVLLNARTLPMIVTARFALDSSKSVTNFFLFWFFIIKLALAFKEDRSIGFALSLSLSRRQIRSNHSSPVEVSLHKLQPSLCQNFSFQLHLT
jgi:3-dehydroquinate dehydratase